MDRHWDENPKVLVFYSQWGKLFAQINLFLTTKQYKVDNIVNFVYYGKLEYTHALKQTATFMENEINKRNKESQDKYKTKGFFYIT